MHSVMDVEHLGPCQDYIPFSKDKAKTKNPNKLSETTIFKSITNFIK